MAYLVVPVSIMRNDGAFIFVVSILEARSFKFFAPFFYVVLNVSTNGVD